MYDELKAVLSSRRDLERGNGATEAELSAAEMQIGSIPQEFRQFLMDFGWVILGHYEVFGVGEGITARNDLVSETLNERSYGRIPNLVPVMNDGAGNLYCVTQDSITPSPVLLSTLDSSPDYVVEQAGFSSWLLNLARGLPHQ
ncbi:SMI1/KNR4 family protein [Herbiconiux ginsengi]|uniref:SMI1/KNR4 family protein n=1 Tax=Herbiconiux ginsengi TaxID=381665 RepID=UPI0015871B58|nr:SMI1/KNR4 family protein [Herbiconiux ginsengi]